MKDREEMTDTIDKEPTGICNSYIAIDTSKWRMSRKHIENYI